MTEVQIREMRPSDRDSIEAVTLAAYQEYAALMAGHWEGYRQNILATLADVQSAAQVVADQNGHIVGTVLLYPAETVIATAESRPVMRSWPEIRLLAVAPTARGQGVGALLIQECVRRAGESGAQFLTLHTTDVMQAAMRLYARMGFQRAPDLDFQPVPGVTIKGYRLSLEETVS